MQVSGLKKELCTLQKYFGTDGVRGIANGELTPELAFKIGRISGYVASLNESRPKVLIGRDPRISGEMLESALISGLLSIGAEVMRLGIISTPGVAYLTKVTNAHLGIIVSASHNPFQDNGIKLFGPNGHKLTDEQEREIEALMDKEDKLPRPTGADLGSVSNYFEGSQKYLSYLIDTVEHDFESLTIGLDCANGATSSLAPHLFADLEAEIDTIGNNPNGLNINEDVGSTNPEALKQLVLDKELDVGFAFDGDGDRLIAIDELGNIVDGDQIMYVCTTYLHEKNALLNDTVIGTVMSNLGFHKAMEEMGINVVQANVGDRHVMEQLRNGKSNFGGEQSGHIIFLDYSTCGDGMLTAIQMANIMVETGKPLSELVSGMKKYPQILENITVENKDRIMHHPRILDEIDRIKKELNNKGRILVRPSGTEPLIRVMIEAETEEKCKAYAKRIISTIKKLID